MQAFNTPASQRLTGSTIFAVRFVVAYLGILLFAFLSYQVNRKLYPGLIPGREFIQMVMAAVATVFAPLIAFALNRSCLWWSLTLHEGHVQLGSRRIGRRIPLGDVLLIRLGSVESQGQGTAHLSITLEVPGILGWGCRVWLSRSDARTCFKALLEACPGAVGIDEWGAERMPSEADRSPEALMRLGQQEVTRAVAAMVSCVVVALLFWAPGALFLVRLLDGSFVVRGNGIFLLFYATPGLTVLLGIIPSARLLRQGRARQREAATWNES